MIERATIRKIRAAAEERANAERAKREATAQLRDYCREARRIGIPVASIASAAGLSRQGVYDLLNEGRR
jgi:DNA invertase Pin-like site-specific DNA recombinase